MSATPYSSRVIDAHPDSDLSPSDATTKLEPMEQFHLVLSIYIGWSVIAWLSHMAGMVTISSRTAVINLIGICATNVLFFTIARSPSPHRPSDEITALAQSVVGIAWATLFTFMSSGSGELSITIYASIVLFAMLRVRRHVLNQITIFAVSSYMIVFIIKMLSREPPSITPDNLVQMLIFAGIMLCLAGTGRYVYRRHNRIKRECAQLQEKLRRDHTNDRVNSVNRRYILDLLAREKGRADRSNIPFCVCIFHADHVDMLSANVEQDVKRLTLKNVEAIIRSELRDMDSLNATGFHDCFGTYSDKEFIAILPQTNLAGAQNSAKRVLNITAQHEIVDDHIRLCGGIAEYRRGELITVLLERAEESLNRARALGANCVCCSDSETQKTDSAEIVNLDTRRR
ncbi:MAG: diguanylate cyclase [Gammaproteobacteria bacterium]|nr:diguanylate cyclase [Gammaproteobacteria bacterium]